MKTLKLFFSFFIFFNVASAQNSIDLISSPEITADEIYSHIQYLASDKLGGRLNGTIGDVLAQQYLSSELEKYGYTPLGDSSYLQRFNLKSKSYIGHYINPVKITLNGIDFILKSSDYQIMQISENGIAKGPVVFAGYGNPNDLFDSNGNPVSIEGKIVILLDSIPEKDYIGEVNIKFYKKLSSKILALKDKNPSGIIVIRADDRKDEGKGMLITNESTQFYFNAGLPVITIRKNIIADILKIYGHDLEKIQYNLDMNRKPDCFELSDSYVEFTDSINRRYTKTANVIGFLEGSDSELKKEVIVVGAHFDHIGKNSSTGDIYYGADDNASGTSAVLEIAQKLSSEKENLKRSVLVIFFGAEEGGINGSAYFNSTGGSEKYNVRTMLNFDMVGRLRNDSLTLYRHEKFPVDSLTIVEINNKYRFNISYPFVYAGRSDQRSFLDKEIPVLAFFNGLHIDYHTHGDTPEKINREGAYKITSFGYDIIRYLCTKN